MNARQKLTTQSRKICFFCAFRYGREIPSYCRAPSFQTKTYHSTTPSRRPAQAAAQQEEYDTNEDEIPMQRERRGPPWQSSYPNKRSSPGLAQHNSRFTPSRESPGLRDWRTVSLEGANPFQSHDNERRIGEFDRGRSGNRSFKGQNDFPRSKRNDLPIRSRAALSPQSNVRRTLSRTKYGTDEEGIYDKEGQNQEYKPQQMREEFSERQTDLVHWRPDLSGSKDAQSFRRSSESFNLKDEFSENTTLASRPDDVAIELPSSDETSLDGKWRARQGKTRSRPRFELEDNGEPQRAPPVKNSRQDLLRLRQFDLEMQEAEAALNGERVSKKKKKAKAEPLEKPRPRLSLPDYVTVQRLAQMMKMKADDLILRLEEEGFEGARYDHLLDSETSSIFADMYGFDAVTGGPNPVEDLIARPAPENASDLPPRPPIVTIMGHVDHGKTTILDWLRKSSVAAGEHGGITQHIGAFAVTMPGSERQITFLDTPGHEAFLDMRKRGANVTDIVVLVVAADDSVKPQTIEAIKHALEARVQIIVAINKVDKEDANIDRVKQDLTRHNIIVEDFGGEYQAIPVSGKTGRGMEELEEAIITLSDVLDLRAEQDGPAEGNIIESKVTNAGRVATILVRRGTLKPGDFIVAGTTWARVRTLRNDTGQLVDKALPGDPVQVDGWRGSDPTAGLEVLQAEDEEQAKNVMELRLEAAESAQAAVDMTAINTFRSEQAAARAKVLEWEKEQKINARRHHDNEGWVESTTVSGPKPVHFVVKADVAGSVEAIVAAVSSIGNHEVQANIVHSGTGALTESDIRLLATTGEVGYAISFNQSIDGHIHRLAEAAGLGILDHNIIYKVTDDVKEKVEAALPPAITLRVLGEAEVGQIFEITVKKQKIRIAGCRITNGTISRANQVRVLRKGEVVYTGKLDSLKNVKKDVTEMRKGSECGMGFEDWEAFEEGDQIQCFEEKEEKRKLY